MQGAHVLIQPQQSPQKFMHEPYKGISSSSRSSTGKSMCLFLLLSLWFYSIDSLVKLNYLNNHLLKSETDWYIFVIIMEK